MNVQEPPKRENTSDESVQSEESEESEESENEAAETVPVPVPLSAHVPAGPDPLGTEGLSRDRCLTLKQKLKAAYKKLKKAHDKYEKDNPGKKNDNDRCFRYQEIMRTDEKIDFDKIKCPWQTDVSMYTWIVIIMGFF